MPQSSTRSPRSPLTGWTTRTRPFVERLLGPHTRPSAVRTTASSYLDRRYNPLPRPSRTPIDRADSRQAHPTRTPNSPGTRRVDRQRPAFDFLTTVGPRTGTAPPISRDRRALNDARRPETVHPFLPLATTSLAARHVGCVLSLRCPSRGSMRLRPRELFSLAASCAARRLTGVWPASGCTCRQLRAVLAAAAWGRLSGDWVCRWLREEQGGLGEDVPVLLAPIDQVDAAETGGGVVQAEVSDRLAYGVFGSGFDLQEGE